MPRNRAPLTVRRLAVLLLLVANAITAVVVVEQARAASAPFRCTRSSSCRCDFEGTAGGWCSVVGLGSKCTDNGPCKDTP